MYLKLAQLSVQAFSPFQKLMNAILRFRMLHAEHGDSRRKAHRKLGPLMVICIMY